MRAYDLARAAHGRRAHDLSYAGQLQARRVQANAEPLIAEFMDGLIELHAASIGTEIEEQERNRHVNMKNNKVVAEVWSNRPSIEARSAAILAAYRDAEAMKADPDQGDLREQFAAVIEALPDASILVKVVDLPADGGSGAWPRYDDARADLIARRASRG